MVQDPKKRTGYDEAWLKVTYPHTYAYLKEFEAVLREAEGSGALLGTSHFPGLTFGRVLRGEGRRYWSPL